MKRSTLLAIPDVHCPLHDEKAVNCVLKAVEILKPTAVVILGDWGEWDSVCRYRWKKKKRPPIEYVLPLIDEEGAEASELLDRFDRVFAKAKVKHKYFMMGNHEVWLDNLVLEHPYLKQYLPSKLLELGKRGYYVTKYGGFLKKGKLTYYHGGWYNGQYHIKKHLQHIGTNLLYAHYHNVGRDSISRLDGTYTGYCIGTLKKCDFDSNTWLNGRAVNWGHAFAAVNYAQDGTFGVDIFDIVNGRCYVWGEEIRG